MPSGATLGADDAARDPAGERTEPPADDEAQEPSQVTLVVGARTAALEHHASDTPNERAAREAKYHSRNGPASGPSLAALHLDPRERSESDCPSSGQRTATKAIGEGKRVAADSGDEGRPSGKRWS